MLVQVLEIFVNIYIQQFIFCISCQSKGEVLAGMKEHKFLLSMCLFFLKDDVPNVPMCVYLSFILGGAITIGGCLNHTILYSVHSFVWEVRG